MALHVDIPTRPQLDRLLNARQPDSVSLFLPTDPASSGEAARIALGNVAREAVRQIEEKGDGRAATQPLAEALEDLADDAAFWRFQARTLAVFATGDEVTTFRLPNRLHELVEVSDRFHVKPLLRAVTFPQAALVLALSQNSARVIEVAPDVAASPVDVAELPESVADVAGKASVSDRSPWRRVQGSEGQKLRMRQYARAVDQALRPTLAGLALPLILAAAEPLASIYRAVSSYPGLAPGTIPGNPETSSDSELADHARGVLDELHRASLQELRETYEQRASADRTATDLAVLARAATFGAVDTVFVDIDEVVPGAVDDEGRIAFAAVDDAIAYGVVDEIARRVWNHGGRVLAVRRDDVPGGGSAAGILRYAL